MSCLSCVVSLGDNFWLVREWGWLTRVMNRVYKRNIKFFVILLNFLCGFIYD